jgi:hypothetical protein
MEHQILTNKEGELWLPPRARWLRYQGKLDCLWLKAG